MATPPFWGTKEDAEGDEEEACGKDLHSSLGWGKARAGGTGGGGLIL